ncbi:Swt1 family HEPN domain-containing protein [Janibacter sp. YB324]|uniref:Swt1 family HEPN domain-containing protein n=1 Tax=Janibacter sp. YB324 TaxID=2761047 RepID=UPI00162AF10D|nr:Swt1 family HEPN domain-containing protein [Janibacter sp. YB324]QNF95362.1 hypothetical protein H7A72_06235 [Janibacter sp. YB324]
MPFKPNLSVKEGLDHLATRLDPIIAAKFKKELGDNPWTVVLEIIDQKKGYAGSYQHWTYDLQAQLRMLTERLGDFGFPFDDHQRTVSTLGNELRIVRKQMAHMYNFSVEEAFRANDFCVRLLEHFGDHDGHAEALQIRQAALAAMATEAGLTKQPPTQPPPTSSPAVLVGPPESLATTDADSEPDLVAPEREVLEREPSIIGSGRLSFEPWIVVQVGTVDVLDDLPKKVAKEKVRTVAVEIATYEGPIKIDRLTDLTALSFGLQRVRASRAKKISYQIRQAGLFVDDEGFVWPREIDPASWSEFRPNDSAAGRSFTDISCVEIANAARFIAAKHPEMPEGELDVSVLQTFGRRRRTKAVVAHLEKAKELM